MIFIYINEKIIDKKAVIQINWLNLKGIMRNKRKLKIVRIFTELEDFIIYT